MWPEKLPRPDKLTIPDEATQREVLQLWHQVVALDRQGRIPTIRGGAPVQPQDKDSGLVEREWRRTGRRGGKLAARTLEGEPVRAAWVDRGIVKRAAGIVRRNDAGELVVRGADGSESPVPRDANVDRARGRSR